MAALSVAILSLSSLIPILTYAAPLFAGCFLLPVIDEAGLKWGWMVWAAVSILSVLVLADKEAAAFYIFIGYYPMLKPVLDRIKPTALSITAKLAVFSLAIGIMYVILCFVLKLEAILQEFRSVSIVINVIFYICMIFVMLVYDKLIEKIMLLYRKRIKPRIRSSLKM